MIPGNNFVDTRLELTEDALQDLERREIRLMEEVHHFTRTNKCHEELLVQKSISRGLADPERSAASYEKDLVRFK